MKLNGRIDIKQNQLLTSTMIIVGGALLLFGSSNIYYNQQIYGHNFAGDESATFLALMDQIQTEMDLINTNLVANNQPLAKEHLNNIDELYTKNVMLGNKLMSFIYYLQNSAYKGQRSKSKDPSQLHQTSNSSCC